MATGKVYPKIYLPPLTFVTFLIEIAKIPLYSQMNRLVASKLLFLDDFRKQNASG